MLNDLLIALSVAEAIRNGTFTQKNAKDVVINTVKKYKEGQYYTDDERLTEVIQSIYISNITFRLVYDFAYPNDRGAKNAEWNYA